MSITSETAQLNSPFPYDEVFSAIVAIIPTFTGFKLKSQGRVIGCITANTGVTVFSRGEHLSLLVERIDDDNTPVAVESATKLGSNSGGVDHHANNFSTVIEAVRLHFRKQQLKNVAVSTTPSSVPLVVGASIRLDRVVPGQKEKRPVGISFSCDKCGQDIVIDQRGAGHRVNCPKCQAEVTVPIAQPDSPKGRTSWAPALLSPRVSGDCLCSATVWLHPA